MRLEFARESRARFDVVFVDPPYRLGLQAAALALSAPTPERAGARVRREPFRVRDDHSSRD